MTPYVPSGRTDPAGLTCALVLSTVGGAVVGVVAHQVAAVARPAFFFALATGASAGAVARLAIAHWRVRSPRLAAVTGAFGALVAWVVAAGVGYVQDREAFERQLSSYRAAAHSGRVDVAVGWGMWTFELAIALTAGAVLTYRSASAPFCETCGEWFPSRAEALPLGGAERFDEACRALHADDGARRGALAATAASGAEPRLELHLRRCATCASGPWFAQLVQLTSMGDKTEMLVGLDGLLDPGVVASCKAARTPPSA